MAAKRDSASGGFDSSLVIAAICTLSFYAVMYLPSMHGTLLQRYTTEHIVEYVIVALFIWGMVDIIQKMSRFPREFMGLRENWLPPVRGREPLTKASEWLAELTERPARLQQTKACRRIIQVLENVTGKTSSEEYADHFRHVANHDAEQTHLNYTLCRFIIAVTPILGFLGTVVHFGTALGSISFNEMTDKLPQVVEAMGTAFNTTSVALFAAMTMMFLTFFCQRVEDRILNSVDRLAERELLRRFDFRDANTLPALNALQSAHDDSLAIIGNTLERQVDQWSESLNALFSRFDERQQQELQNWREAFAALQQHHQSHVADHQQWLDASLAAIDERHDRQLDRIETALETALEARGQLTGLVNTLETVAHGEGKLAELQASLSENLRVLEQTHRFDEALHALTAAIHLLTARHQRRGDGPGAAAA